MNSIMKAGHKIQNRLRRLKQFCFESKRSSSYPFLACDTYALGADLWVSGKEDLGKLESWADEKTVYAEVSSASMLLEKLQSIQTAPQLRAIYLGDSDVPAPEDVLSKLLDFCQKIYCVNLMKSNTDRIVCLPIGLENKKYSGGGLLENYKKQVSFEVDSRPIGLLISWNDETNLNERLLARSTLIKSSLTYEVRERLPFQSMSRLMRSALMVPCPVGNGVDTHRFWEALYLGALPVILRKNELDFDFDVPKLSISDWSELLALERIDLEELYLEQLIKMRAFKNTSRDYLDRQFHKGISC